MKPGIASVAPLTIGPANCEAVLGVSWRWLRDHAKGLELTILRVNGKPFVEAAAALEAIRRHGVKPQSEEPPQDTAPEADELSGLCKRLGLRRRFG